LLRSSQLTIEPGHQDDTVYAHLPLLGKHDLGLLPESSRSLLVTVLLCLKELLGFGEAAANKTNTDGKTSSNPKDGLPGLDCTTDTQIGTGSEYVTHRITLLQDTRHETTSFGGTVLESHCDGVSVSVIALVLRKIGKIWN
jgi:hypothetical protein